MTSLSYIAHKHRTEKDISMRSFTRFRSHFATLLLVLLVCSMPAILLGNYPSNPGIDDPCQPVPDDKTTCPTTECGTPIGPEATASSGSGSGCSSSSCASDNPLGSGDVAIASLSFKLYLGGSSTPGQLDGGVLRLFSEDAKASLSTPSALRYEDATGITLISSEKTAADAPRELTIVNRHGIDVPFRFQDGSTVANPQGRFRTHSYKLVMVNADGTPVLSNPVYYDLVYKNGSSDRIPASSGVNQPGGIQPLSSVCFDDGRRIEISNSGIDVKRDVNGVLRQIKVPQGLANIIIDTPFRYSIDVFSLDSVGSVGLDGLYATNGAPLVSWLIENPDGTNSVDRLNITRKSGGNDTVYSFEYATTGSICTWSLDSGDLAVHTARKVTDEQEITEEVTYETAYTNGVIVASRRETSRNLGWGRAPVSMIIDPDGAALETTSTYYTDSSEAGRYAQLKSRVYPDGRWARYDYDADRRLASAVKPWENSLITDPDSKSRVVLYSYTSLDANDVLSETDQRPRTVTCMLGTSVVSRTYDVYKIVEGERIHITEQASSPTALYSDLGNQRITRTYYADTADSNKAGHLYTIQQPDGRLTTYNYESGTLSANTDPSLRVFTAVSGSYFRVTATHGTVDNPIGIAARTSREVAITDESGNLVLSEVYAYEGGSSFSRINWTARGFDDSGHVTDEYRSDGTTTEAVWASCGCGKESEIDAQGLTTEYQYDDLKRLDFTSRELGTNNIITTFIYDAAGRKLSSITSADGIVPLISTNTYDLAGRITWSRDNAGIETTYLYAGLTNITIGAGLTNTTVNYLDGRTHYTAQNGIIKQTYTYGPGDSQVAPGTQWTKVYTGPDGTNSPAWSQTTTDMLGRTIKTERPGFGGTTITNEMFYNSIGQLTKTTSTGSAPTLYEYNELGEQIRTAQDINENGTIDISGTDRITESDSYYEEINSDYWMTSISKIYAQANSSAVTTNGIRRNRLTGLSAAKTSESVSIDILGNETTNTVSIDRSNKVRVGLMSAPDSIISSTNTTVNGLQVSSTTKTGLEYTYAFDALGRRTGTTDPRIGESITHYNAKGQVDYTEDAATNRTIYVYDSATGRRTSVTNALDEATYSHYSPEGQLLATWGNTYPVAYEYDEYDRMSAMYTLRDTNITINSYSSIMNNTSSFDKTSWLYDAPTGLLTNKVYDDGNGPSYTYYPNGKLETREWARGATTTYSYDDCCGSLTNITYSDNTPTVIFTYNRLGQQETISDAQGTRAFTYNDLLQLTHETTVANGETNTITRNYNTLGRASGVALNDDYAVTYGYDDTLGRFHSVSSSVNSVSSVVNYSYLENSSLIAGYTGPNDFEVTKSYEPNRNLIVGISNYFGANCISAFAYDNDALGRRTERLDFDENLVAITNSFVYNGYSELTNAVMNTDNYNYTFDDIGNRIKTFSTVDSVTSEMDYLSNALNQYTNISYGQGSSLPTYDADGNMLTNGDWTFTWNGENRLITASNATTIVNFKYDYMGRRFEKSVEGGATKTFIYDGWNPIAEFSTGVAPSTNYFTWGLDLSGRLQGAGGVGGLLSTVQDGDIYFSCFDANGNVTDYVDETGDIVAHYEYNPFGGIISSTGDKKDDFNFRFSTKYLDPETGLYYYGYRYYLPELGRWINRDPIGENIKTVEIISWSVDLNDFIPIFHQRIPFGTLYHICYNNTVSDYDYLGLCICVFKGSVGKLKIDCSCAGILKLWVIPEKGSNPAFTPAKCGKTYDADGFKIGNQIYKVDGSTCATIICKGGQVHFSCCVNCLAKMGGKKCPPYPVSPGGFENEPPSDIPAKPVFK